jgi:hypothetical protein
MIAPHADDKRGIANLEVAAGQRRHLPARSRKAVDGGKRADAGGIERGVGERGRVTDGAAAIAAGERSGLGAGGREIEPGEGEGRRRQ